MTDAAILYNMDKDDSPRNIGRSGLEILCDSSGHSGHEVANPEWITNLLEYFEFCERQTRIVKEKDKDRKRDYFTLKCSLCMTPEPPLEPKQGVSKNSTSKKASVRESKDVKIVGCNASSFSRHLQVNTIFLKVRNFYLIVKIKNVSIMIDFK